MNKRYYMLASNGTVVPHELDNGQWVKFDCCPFCGEGDFDLVRLKNHFVSGHCEEYESVNDPHSRENICLKCRYEDDEKCPARKEFVDGSVGEMFAHAIACIHFRPKLKLVDSRS